MMTRKKRRMLLIISIIIVISILLGIFIVLYINTDMFKPNANLFAKYIGQNLENVEAIYQNTENNKFDSTLKQGKYTTQTQITVSDEDEQNSVNQLKIQINGQTDKTSDYNYQDINLLNEQENIAEVQYIQEGDINGLKFTGLFDQYILIENESLKEVLKRAGYTSQELTNIPDDINLDFDFSSILEFSKEEKQTLKTKYLTIINENVSRRRFSKQSNQVISIDDKNLRANAYVLTLTKEQFNNLIIKILEEMKQDEIVLSKIEQIQAMLQDNNLYKDVDLTQQFTAKLDDKISTIRRNNIGEEEAKILVYENNGNTVKTTIQSPDYEISIEILQDETGKYSKISYIDNLSAEEKSFTYKNTPEEMSINYSNNENGKMSQYNFIINENIEENSGTKNIIIGYEDDSNSVQATIEQTISQEKNLKNKVKLSGESTINLSELDEETLKIIIDRIKTGVTEKINEITTSKINVEDLKKVLEKPGIIKSRQDIQVSGITETEKNRFNSKFEILQGENLENESMLRLIETVKENLINVEIASNVELKLKIDRYDSNEEMAEALTNFIEESRNRKYNVKTEYDETTGLVNGLSIIIQEN